MVSLLPSSMTPLNSMRLSSKILSTDFSSFCCRISERAPMFYSPSPDFRESLIILNFFISELITSRKILLTSCSLSLLSSCSYLSISCCLLLFRRWSKELLMSFIFLISRLQVTVSSLTKLFRMMSLHWLWYLSSFIFGLPFSFFCFYSFGPAAYRCA